MSEIQFEIQLWYAFVFAWGLLSGWAVVTGLEG